MSQVTPAKTVSFSPLRPVHASFKNTLDNPIKLKWPELPRESIEALMMELENCLEGMKVSTMRCNKTRKRMNKRKKSKQTEHSSPDKEPTNEPPTKKQCLGGGTTGISPSSDHHHTIDTTLTHTEDITRSQPLHEDPDSNITDKVSHSKRSQMIVGVNAVSRCLERRGLEGVRGGMVCLSAQPALILRHLMMLAATRGVPFVALPNLSQTAAPRLGVKTALAIGFKKVCSDESDHFTEIVNKITKLAPPINIPWLTVQREPPLPMSGKQSDQGVTEAQDGANSSKEPTTGSSSTTSEQEHTLEDILTHQNIETKKVTTIKRQGEEDLSAIVGEELLAESSKNRGQYLPLQIKRVLTSKKKRK